MHWTRIGRIRIAVGLALLLAPFVGQRLFVQFAPTAIFVPQRAPLPATFSNAFETGSSVFTNYHSPVPFEAALDKRVLPSDIRAVRRKLAWSFLRARRPHTIQVMSEKEITASCRIDRHRHLEVHFEKRSGNWRITQVMTSIE